MIKKPRLVESVIQSRLWCIHKLIGSARRADDLLVPSEHNGWAYPVGARFRVWKRLWLGLLDSSSTRR